MLRTFAAVLLATSMLGGAALAAAPAGSAGAPQTTTAQARSQHAAMHKLATHSRKPRHQLASTKHHGVKAKHHVKAGKTRKNHVAGKAEPQRGGNGDRLAGVNTAKLPAAKSRTN